VAKTYIVVQTEHPTLNFLLRSEIILVLLPGLDLFIECVTRLLHILPRSCFLVLPFGLVPPSFNCHPEFVECRGQQLNEL
jgi:hypothetical protein